MPLKAVAFNCTLKSSNEPSSTELLITQILETMNHYGVHGEIERIVDHNIKPGVTSDEGNGDAWPRLAQENLGLANLSSWHADLAWPAVKRV